ncbi:unnamed protein product [Moneuplotes crassus]|uniref:Uncharacterized protein n=1 Tax=Euplotes crassus TaxID=5936 RepID=A0AAD1UQ61_EUPCR|nr:unnamed protein product [Moneuplotes crassus]
MEYVSDEPSDLSQSDPIERHFETLKSARNWDANEIQLISSRKKQKSRNSVLSYNGGRTKWFSLRTLLSNKSSRVIPDPNPQSEDEKELEVRNNNNQDSSINDHSVIFSVKLQGDVQYFNNSEDISPITVYVSIRTRFLCCKYWKPIKLVFNPDSQELLIGSKVINFDDIIELKPIFIRMKKNEELMPQDSSSNLRSRTNLALPCMTQNDIEQKCFYELKIVYCHNSTLKMYQMKEISGEDILGIKKLLASKPSQIEDLEGSQACTRMRFYQKYPNLLKVKGYQLIEESMTILGRKKECQLLVNQQNDNPGNDILFK